VYVAVTSLDPLRVYPHEEGLVRFAARRYSSSTSTYCQRRRHLTNYSINKAAMRPSSDGVQRQGHSSTMPAGAASCDRSSMDDGGGVGCSEGDDDEQNGCDIQQHQSSKRGQTLKWSLKQLRSHL